MSQSIDALMECVGCRKWPERWRQVYDRAMAAYDRDGCIFTEPDYYDSLAEQYHILTKELDVYKKAAAEVGAREDLSRFLMLICTALEDETCAKDDLEAFQEPHSAPGTPSLGLDMLTGLALCSQMPRCYARLKQRNLPEHIIRDAMAAPEVTVERYRQRYGGAPGFDLLGWYQRTIQGKLLRIGRLEIQIPATYQGFACVFENDQMEHVLLAHNCQLHRDGIALGARGYEDADGAWTANIEETPEAWWGYPYDPSGCVRKEPVCLDKSVWRKILSKGDPVIALHIPAGGKFDPQTIDDTMAEIRQFLRTYYPDYPYQAFACNSWMMNPRVAELLGEDSNIARFCRRFQPVTRKMPGSDVFTFVFSQGGGEIDLDQLPENTALQRKLKQYYRNGGILHEMTGFFL